ncbi:hypothetical protein EauM23_00002 [Exiguobacterium phage vB_EauM-23]|nr:hypothetical protein EauM23_00002 [Exiguobacterium phage vB_EauM-23]
MTLLLTCLIGALGLWDYETRRVMGWKWIRYLRKEQFVHIVVLNNRIHGS